MNGKQMEMDSKDKGKSFGKTFVQMLVGAALGYGWIMALDWMFGIKTLVTASTGAGLVAFALAMIFSLIGMIVIVMSCSRKMYTYNRIYEDMGAEEYAEQRPILRWSGICLILYAATFVLLALGDAAGGIQQPGYFWGVVVAMVAQTAINLYLWKGYDELWRQTVKDTSAISFNIVSVILFIWAAATIFGMGVAFDPLMVVVAMMLICCLVSVWLTVKKGMTK